MRTSRSLACIVVISALYACGQRPDEPTAQQQQASSVQAPTAETPQTQPGPVTPSTPAHATTPAPASAPATAQDSNAAAQGSSLTAQSSSLNDTETDFDIQINLLSDVLFDFDEAELKPETDRELQEAADIIRQKGKGLILVSGYIDNKGTDAYNKRLSLVRAQTVKNWFEAQGLHQNYQTEDLSTANPVTSNTNDDGSDDPKGHAKNRRVKIIVSKTEQLGE